MLTKFEEEHKARNTPSNDDDVTPTNDEESKQTLILQLPFRGSEGDALVRSLKNTLKRNLPDTECKILHPESKLSQSNLKDGVDENT